MKLKSRGGQGGRAIVVEDQDIREGRRRGRHAGGGTWGREVGVGGGNDSGERGEGDAFLEIGELETQSMNLKNVIGKI